MGAVDGILYPSGGASDGLCTSASLGIWVEPCKGVTASCRVRLTGLAVRLLLLASCLAWRVATCQKINTARQNSRARAAGRTASAQATGRRHGDCRGDSSDCGSLADDDAGVNL